MRGTERERIEGDTVREMGDKETKGAEVTNDDYVNNKSETRR